MDDYLPDYDFSECHELYVDATPEEAYKAFKELDYSKSLLLKCLLFFRGIRFSKQLRSLFVPLVIDPPRRHLEGLIGRPWTISGGIIPFDAEEFIDFDQPGYAKVIWEFTFTNEGNGCLVKTETRIQCTDVGSLKKFSCYWFFVRPFSGLVRRIILKMIRDTV